jgi:hypothetical protein
LLTSCRVVAPPKLSPFGPPLSLHVGERASMTCSVVSGDQPLSLLWLKDGRPLEEPRADPLGEGGGERRGQRGQQGAGPRGPRVTQNRVDQYNSILLIESLSPEHNGSYTCSASNQAATVSQVQELLVNGTPSPPAARCPASPGGCGAGRVPPGTTWYHWVPLATPRARLESPAWPC